MRKVVKHNYISPWLLCAAMTWMICTRITNFTVLPFIIKLYLQNRICDRNINIIIFFYTGLVRKEMKWKRKMYNGMRSRIFSWIYLHLNSYSGKFVSQGCIRTETLEELFDQKDLQIIAKYTQGQHCLKEFKR